jgi:hypothetical protein
MDTSIMATALENAILFIGISTASLWFSLKLYELIADKLGRRWR